MLPNSPSPPNNYQLPSAITTPAKCFDTIVVGGGVVGLSVASALVQAGLSVLQIYRKASKAGVASRAAGAMLGAFGEISFDQLNENGLRELDFRVKSQRLFPGWLSSITDASGQRIRVSEGTFIIGNTEGHHDRRNIRAIRQELERYGARSEWVEAEDVPGLMPALSKMPHSCLYIPEENSVDTDDLIHALETALANSGKHVHLEDEVAAVRRWGKTDEWETRLNSGASFKSCRTVVCAGSRTAEVLGSDVYEATGIPQLCFGKGVSCVVTGAPHLPHTIRTPNRAFACGIHVVPRGGDCLYIGATNFFGTDHLTETGVETGELHMLFDQAIHQINTCLRRARISEVRYGYRPVTMSREPVFGKTSMEGLYLATGTYRNGIVMAPLIASIVAKEMLSEETENAYPAFSRRPSTAVTLDKLVETGIEDLIAIAHEPGGILPYDRSRELARFTTVLFKIAVAEEGKYLELGKYVRHRLLESPLNETLNRLYYEIMAQ